MSFTDKDKDHLFALLEKQLQVLIWIHNLQTADSEYTSSDSHNEDVREIQRYLK